MDLVAGYEFRAPAPDDLTAVGEVVAADDLGEAGEVVLGEDFVRAEWSRAGFDIATDAWVAVDSGGSIVAYGQVMLEEPGLAESWGSVHPDHRGRGIGTALLDLIDARARDLLDGAASSRFRHAIYAGDRAAASLLRERGLRPIHHFWHMQILLDGPVEPGSEPRGIDIGGIEPPDDLAVVHGVLAEAFVDDLSHHPTTVERWVRDETGSPGYDPSLWLIAREAGAPAGVLTASAGDDRGWIEYLAVLAPYRGRGVGSALLRRSFSMLADRGVRRVLVSVDAANPTGATGVYERVGMRIVNQWDQWERGPA
jgi:GNAT superfamily N-acetyltransferase